MTDQRVQRTIDHTNLSNLTVGEGETIAGSSADDISGDTSTQLWSDRLPRSSFSDMQQRAVEALLVTDDLETVADDLGCSPSTVRKAGQKAAAICDPTDTALKIPDNWPSWGRKSLKSLNESEIREGAFDNADPDPEAQETADSGASEATREVLGRYHVLDQPVSEIQAEMGRAESEVTGALAARDVVPQEQWIVPEQSQGDSQGHKESDKPPQTADLGGCDCPAPSLSVDAAQLGPEVTQSLYCSVCDHEFARVDGGDLDD